jgi:hypothetical protein
MPNSKSQATALEIYNIFQQRVEKLSDSEYVEVVEYLVDMFDVILDEEYGESEDDV